MEPSTADSNTPTFRLVPPSPIPPGLALDLTLDIPTMYGEKANKRTYSDFARERQENRRSAHSNLLVVSMLAHGDDSGYYAPKSRDLRNVPKGGIINPFRRSPTRGFAHCRAIGAGWKPYGLKISRGKISGSSIPLPAAKRQKLSSSPLEGEVADKAINSVVRQQTPPVSNMSKTPVRNSVGPGTPLSQAAVGEKRSSEFRNPPPSNRQGDYYRPRREDNRQRRSRSRSPSRDSGPCSKDRARDVPHPPRDHQRRRSPFQDYRSERPGYYRDRDGYTPRRVHEGHTDHHDRYSQRGDRYPRDGDKSHRTTSAPKVSERQGQIPTRRYNTRPYGNWDLEDLRKEIKLRRLVMPSSGEAKTMIKVLVYDDDAHKKIVKEASDKTPIIDLERDFLSRRIWYPIDRRSRRQLVDAIASEEAGKAVNGFFKRNPDDLNPSSQNKKSAETSTAKTDTESKTSNPASTSENEKRLKEHKECREKRKASRSDCRRVTRSPRSANGTLDKSSTKVGSKATDKVGKEILRTRAKEQSARFSESSHSSPSNPGQCQSSGSPLDRAEGKNLSAANAGSRKSPRLQGVIQQSPDPDLITGDEDEDNGSEIESDNAFIVDDAPKRKQKRFPPMLWSKSR
ncbi:hypothetical protein BCR34DRAFT_78979 [Clohesyomyces aquaticus]|uniref:Uncharacterized protein n=1 Tax=Clohesyomyces aquaticus TaxID=1231657 RepID=A0A1Y1YXG6_9PLEO|nr:hypothetical protein BCR34DRAFT_78979 [Clohesyomyces aquaticus]